MDDATRERVLRCATDAGIDPDRLGEITPSWSNHAVAVGGPTPAFLRVCWLGNTARLSAEAMAMDELPREVGCPRLLDHGRVGELTWSLTARLDGDVLSGVWSTLTSGQRADAARATADRLTALYEHRPSPALVEVLLQLAADDDLLGSAILAWPINRLTRMLDDPRCTLDPSQRAGILTGLRTHPDLLPRVDEPGLGLVHGDLHASNIWFDGRQVSGVIDLEWIRLAEPWADLGRSHEKVLAERAEGGAGPHREFVTALVAALPAWQVDPQRRAMATLGYLVRQALLWEPFSEDSPPDHAVLLTDQVLAQLGPGA